VRFVEKAGLIDQPTRKRVVQLLELRNDYAHASGKNPEADALRALAASKVDSNDATVIDCSGDNGHGPRSGIIASPSNGKAKTRLSSGACWSSLASLDPSRRLRTARIGTRRERNRACAGSRQGGRSALGQPRCTRGAPLGTSPAL
jgi:hypothetical protein